MPAPNTDLAKKNFGLTEFKFNQLLQQLQQGQENLIEDVYLKHVKNCVHHLMYRRGSTYDDAFSCATDALIEIRNDLLDNKISYGNLESYFTQRSGLIYGRRYQRNKLLGKSSHDSLEDLNNSSNTIESDLIELEIKAIVAEAIRKLCKDCQELLQLHYFEDQSFKRIAEKLNKKHAAILQKVKRCRDKLRTYVGEPFYNQFKSFLNN